MSTGLTIWAVFEVLFLFTLNSNSGYSPVLFD